MDLSIASILTLDGVTNGAVYGLLALATVLVFAITRVIFIPQGEFVAYGALTLAVLQTGQVPGTVWLLAALALLAAVLDAVAGVRRGLPAARIGVAAVKALVLPAAVLAFTLWAAPRQLPLVLQSLLTLAIVAPLGPLVYRLAYEKLADATVLVLLIVSVGVHFALTGFGLLFFGAEGFRNPSFWDARFAAGPLTLTGQTLIIFMVSAALVARPLPLLRTHAARQGAARDRGEPARCAADGHLDLRRRPAELRPRRFHRRAVGPPDRADHDDVLRLRLPDRPERASSPRSSAASRVTPAAALGALFVGLLESFSSFYASAFKEVIVFTLIIPVLLWRSFQHGHDDEEH